MSARHPASLLAKHPARLQTRNVRNKHASVAAHGIACLLFNGQAIALFIAILSTNLKREQDDT